MEHRLAAAEGEEGIGVAGERVWPQQGSEGPGSAGDAPHFCCVKAEALTVAMS